MEEQKHLDQLIYQYLVSKKYISSAESLKRDAILTEESFALSDENPNRTVLETLFHNLIEIETVRNSCENYEAPHWPRREVVQCLIV